MRRAAFADVARNAVTRAAVGMALACAMGLWPPFPEAHEAGLILSQIAGEGVGNLLLAWRIWQRDRALLAWPGPRRLLAMAKRWRGLALPLALGDGIAMAYARLPVLAIGWLFGPAAVGLYAWAERFTVLPAQLIANAIGDVYRQRATAEFHRVGRFDALMRKTLAMTTALALPPYLLGMLIAPALFGWVFGPAWQAAGDLAQILLVGGLVAFAVTPVDKAAIICQRTGFILLWHGVRLALKLAAVGLVAAFSLPLTTLLWLIVLIRIGLYSVDLAFCYHLAKGGHAGRSRRVRPLASPPPPANETPPWFRPTAS
jgi:O-antigen/teichoic acid export membrane protein